MKSKGKTPSTKQPERGAMLPESVAVPIRVLPNLYRFVSSLRGHQQPVNSYVWWVNGSAVLVDPAGDLTPPVLSSIGVDKVADVLITHVQEENAAGALHFPGARVHVPAGDEYLCEGRTSYEQLIETWPPPWEWETRGNYRGHLAGARNERPLQKKIELSSSLSEGKPVAGVTVIPTPGHGKNAVTLLAGVDGKRVAFCGDLICGDGKLWNWFDSEWDYGLEGGQRALLDSARRLARESIDLLCPTHGPAIRDPGKALDLLCERLLPVLEVSVPSDTGPINFPEKPSPAPGFRELLPKLHQYCREPGNCNVLLSETGAALMVDDGLCHWVPLPERAAYHRQVVADLKRELGIQRIEIVIPTHYHGDHIENIPDLVATEGSEIVCLDMVADVIERPGHFNLASPLPWYGTAHDAIQVDRRITSGARVRWQEYELEFFHLGGQTFYHAGIEVVIGDVRTLFVGDSMSNSGRLCEPVLCYNKSDPATAGWAYAIERMIERTPDLLVCGHAGAVRDPMPLLRQKEAAWVERIKAFESLSARKSPREFFDPFA